MKHRSITHPDDPRNNAQPSVREGLAELISALVLLPGVCLMALRQCHVWPLIQQSLRSTTRTTSQRKTKLLGCSVKIGMARLVASFTPFLLSACVATAQAPAIEGGPTMVVGATGVPPGDFGPCDVTVRQGARVVQGRIENGRSIYKLAAAPFRVEVSSPACRPGWAVLLPTEVDHILRTPLVASIGAYWGAGSTAAGDILIVRGGNPRTTLEEEISMATNQVDGAHGQYRAVCTSLGYCPTVVKDYASIWPFLEMGTQADRGFAEFRRFDERSPISDAQGRVIHTMVYTHWKVLNVGPYTSWRILRPHALVFDFR